MLVWGLGYYLESIILLWHCAAELLYSELEVKPDFIVNSGIIKSPYLV